MLHPAPAEIHSACRLVLNPCGKRGGFPRTLTVAKSAQVKAFALDSHQLQSFDPSYKSQITKAILGGIYQNSYILI